jgi:hypothetical protein
VVASIGGNVPNPTPAKRKTHNRQPKPYEWFIRAIQPTPDEVASMMIDLCRVCGDWAQVEITTGIPQIVACEWIWGRNRPSFAAAKAIFLYWAILCRPGEIDTVFNLSTCGRFTKRGDPATAGDPRSMKRNLRKFYKQSAKDGPGN